MKTLSLLVVLLFAGFSTFAQEYKRLNLLNNDICYINAQDRIYAITPGEAENGNSLCIIDPHFATVDTCFFVGSEPSMLALSSDEQFLYVGFDGTSVIKRVDVAASSIDLTFNLDYEEDNSSWFAEEMLVLPMTLMH